MLTWLLWLLFLDHAKLFLRIGLLWGDQVTPLRGVRPMPGASTVQLVVLTGHSDMEPVLQHPVALGAVVPK